MSTYKNLSRGDLPKFLNMIEDMFKHIVTNGTLDVCYLRYYLLLLYEYCICYAYFQLLPDVNTIDHAEINLKYLKSFCRSMTCDDLVIRVCFTFYTVRNNSTHLTKELLSSDEVLSLISQPQFYSVLQCCSIPDYIMDTLRELSTCNDSTQFDSIERLKEFFGANMSMLPAAYSQVQITEAECKDIISTFGYLKA